MENNVLSEEQIEMIDKIDSKLDILLHNMEYDSYLDFLKSDDYMTTYDTVLGYYDVNYFPEAFLTGLTIEFLEKILNRVEGKIKELNIEER